jgi:outer membrane protein TolC
MRWIWIAAVAFWLSGAPRAGAGIVAIDLEEAVRRAQERSPTARKLTLQEQRAHLSYSAVRRTQHPQLTLDMRAPMVSQQFAVEAIPGPTDTVQTEDGPVTFPRQVFGKTTTTRTNAATELRLRQLLPWRGTLHASSSIFYRDEETDPEFRDPRNDYTVNAEVGIDVTLVGDDSDRRELERSLVEHEMALEREGIARAQLTFEATSRYLSLLRASLSLGIVRSAVEQTARAHDQAERKVAQGLLPEVEFLRMQVILSERRARLAETETQLARISDAFKVFLGVALSDSLLLSEELEPFELDVAVEDAVRFALLRRAEIGLGERELALLEMDRHARRPWIPQVALSILYGGAAAESSLDRAIRELSANNLSFQVSLQFPIWDGGRATLEEEMERAAIRLHQLELEDQTRNIELEVRDAVRQLQDAQRRRRLFESSAALAEESLRISTERFERGLLDTDGFLSAQTEVASVRLGLTGALLDLYQARARLRLVTMSPDL